LARIGVRLLGFAFLSAARAVSAHHSTAEFDYSKTVVLEATIKEVQWTNPHSYVQAMVPQPDGKVVQWGVEIGAPAINVAMGWRKSSVKPGDKVTLEISPARSGAPYGTLRHLTFPDGRKLDGVAARIPKTGIGG
jgi:uncharacterized protein DUF6152